MSTTQIDAASILQWGQVVARARWGNVTPPRRVEKSDAEWRAVLTQAQYYVTRCKDTKRASKSEFCALFEPGRYHCVCCHTPLFDGRTGWPSFTAPLAFDVVAYHLDTRHGAPRIATTCNVCDAHLGHVFPGCPPPSGLVYCSYAVSLRKLNSLE